MEKGYNSDLSVKGKSYHVQTEDWGQENPFIVSRIFYGGAVLKTIKTPYSEIIKYNLQSSSENNEDLRLALRQQHHRILDQIFSGEI